MAPTRTARWIPAPALCETRGPWRLLISYAARVSVIWGIVLPRHVRVPRGQRRLSGLRVTCFMLCRSLSVSRLRPRLRRSAARTAQGSMSSRDRFQRWSARSGSGPAIPRSTRAASALCGSGEEIIEIGCPDAFGAFFARHASRFTIHFTTSRMADRLPARASRRITCWCISSAVISRVRTIGDGEPLFQYNVESGAFRVAGGYWPAAGITATTLGKPAGV
jgi:hypothetical protein